MDMHAITNPIYQLCVPSCKLGRTFNSVRTFLVACPDINKLFSSSARHSWVIKYMAHGLTRRYNLILTCGFLFLRCFFKTIERASDLCLSLLPTIIISVVSVIKVRIFVSTMIDLKKIVNSIYNRYPICNYLTLCLRSNCKWQ